MSRGQKGCYVYCCDEETAEYFGQQLGSFQPEVPAEAEAAVSGIGSRRQFEGLDLRILSDEEARPYENCVPVYDLAIAAGSFESGSSAVSAWVELSDAFRPAADLFVARVVGESMNRRIPNGAWCLFRANPPGTRNNKIVIAQHRRIQDPDTDADYTIKRYLSEKAVDEKSWHHRRIVLRPDSTDSIYADIVLSDNEDGEMRIIGEFVAVI